MSGQWFPNSTAGRGLPFLLVSPLNPGRKWEEGAGGATVGLKSLSTASSASLNSFRPPGIGARISMQFRPYFKFLIFVGMLLLALLIGWTDLVTGYKVSVLAFYSIPIVLAVWWVGSLGGFLIALESAVICYFVRKAAVDAPHLTDGVALWNALMRFTTFMLFCIGGAAVRFKVETLRRQVKMLTGILPICNCCKKIKDEQGYWNDMEAYLHEHSEVDVARKLCPDCSRRLQAGKLTEAAVESGARAPIR